MDVAGNRLVWWQTRGRPLPLGQAIHVRGRVERHTHFGRAAVTPWLAAVRSIGGPRPGRAKNVRERGVWLGSVPRDGYSRLTRDAFHCGSLVSRTRLPEFPCGEPGTSRA
jgi:hypothetical protein